MKQILDVEDFTFSLEPDRYEILSLKGANLYEDRNIWLEKAENGEGWDVFITYRPEDDDNRGSYNPVGLNRSWAKKFKTEMQEDQDGEVKPWNMGSNLTTDEVKGMVRYFRRTALVGILRAKRDRECYGEDLEKEKWDNYWAGEGYSGY
jgi:hypothetical protein